MYIIVDLQTEYYTDQREIGAHRLLRKWIIIIYITLYMMIKAADYRLYTAQL